MFVSLIPLPNTLASISVAQCHYLIARWLLRSFWDCGLTDLLIVGEGREGKPSSVRNEFCNAMLSRNVAEFKVFEHLHIALSCSGTSHCWCSRGSLVPLWPQGTWWWWSWPNKPPWLACMWPAWSKRWERGSCAHLLSSLGLWETNF